MKTLVVLAAFGLVACGHAPPPPPHAPAASLEYAALVAAPDRTDADRALDPGRHPARMLEFLAVRPGMKVADLMAGGGYTTELLARAVGPTGVVYGQNSPFVLQKFAEAPFTARLQRPINKNVVRVDRELESPLPPEAHDLDLVVMNAFYHDAVWQNVNREQMNKAIFDALRHGGVFVVIDSSARPGAGLADVKTLHRIEEQVVRDEVTRAGFRLEGESAFLRNPADPRDWSASPSAAGERRGTSDRFALRFVKP